MELTQLDVKKKFKKMIREIKASADIETGQWYAVGGMFRIHSDAAKTVELQGLQLQMAVDSE